MNIGKVYIPKGFAAVVVIFAAILALAASRGMGVAAGLSMACLFGWIASLAAYIISAVKKRRSGVYLFAFVVLLAGMIISNLFTAEYAKSQQIGISAEETTYTNP